MSLQNSQCLGRKSPENLTEDARPWLVRRGHLPEREIMTSDVAPNFYPMAPLRHQPVRIRPPVTNSITMTLARSIGPADTGSGSATTAAGLNADVSAVAHRDNWLL